MNQTTEQTSSASQSQEKDAAATEKAGQGDSHFVTFSTALMLCVFTSVITLMIVIYGPAIATKQGIKLPGAGHLTGSKVVYLDFERVLSAGVEQAMKSGANVEEAKVKADKFQIDIKNVITSYTDSGYSVINAKALIQGASGDDITGEVINKLLGNK